MTMQKSVSIQQQNSLILHRQKKAPLSIAVTVANREKKLSPYCTCYSLRLSNIVKSGQNSQNHHLPNIPTPLHVRGPISDLNIQS